MKHSAATAASPSATVSARMGAMIVAAAAARGVAADGLMAAAGFDPAWLHDPDARIPLTVETRLWDEATRRSADPAFGLHVAAAIRPGMFQVLDYAVRTAPIWAQPCSGWRVTTGCCTMWPRSTSSPRAR